MSQDEANKPNEPNKPIEPTRDEPEASPPPLARRALWRLAWTAVWISPPFLLLAGYFAAHRLGLVERNPEIAYERTLIASVVFHWLVATLLVAALVHLRGLLAWIRRNRMALLAMTFSTLLSLGFAEIALRILRPGVIYKRFRTIPSERLHHRNSPDARAAGMGRDVVVTNADGFRTPYTREEFLDHDLRVAVLGDSFVFGLGVAGEAALPAVLEERLRERLDDRSVAVLNTGVISYSPFLERISFRDDVRPYRPHLTVLVLDVNDVGDDYQYERLNVSGDPDHPRFDVPEPDPELTLCDRLAFCHNLKPLLWRLRSPVEILGLFVPLGRDPDDYYDFRITVGDTVETNRFFVLRHPLEVTRPHFERTLGYVRQLAREVRASGSEFALVVSPRYFHWNDAECPENWEAHRYGVDEPYEFEYLRFFEEAAGRVDFPVLPLLPAFAESEELPLVFAHDPHWNEAGHQVAGGALADALLAEGLVPE